MPQPLVDKLLHLGLFVAAIGFAGVAAVAVLERVVGSKAPVMRVLHLVVAGGAVVTFAVAERVYHLLA